MTFCVSPQGGIGEKGAEGTAGNDGARVSESPLPAELGTNCQYHTNLPELSKIKFIVFPYGQDLEGDRC